MYKLLGTVKTRAARAIWRVEELGVHFEPIAAPPQSDEVVALNACPELVRAKPACQRAMAR